ncbi:hypothetical protein M3M38_02445 [Fructilactobacillus cliffordii]|uniref:hypothetical protein n=1 Tax=Fructilactobacillus cliffordii TaxID=2940299 RepID=UPI002092009D|nr:hypothetical protein [Fructilactobacillus cliffordii]USS86945.1 hypothetical protein M3M38_02445 [Fructilactobacillus cliffordii]
MANVHLDSNLIKEKNMDQFIDRITDASFDDSQCQSLVISDVKVLNFDKIKENFENKKFKYFKSADTMFWLDSNFDDIIFVEFKNGQYKHVKNKDLRMKIYDSMIILSNIFELTICQIFNKVRYVIVYNDEFPSINKIHEEIADLANTESIKTGWMNKIESMESLENVIVKKIDGLTSEEFKYEFDL